MNFLDEQLLHQVRLDRVENGIIENVLKLLDKANIKVKKMLLETNGVHSKKRYTEISKYIEEVSAELTKQIKKGMTFDDFVDYELEAQKKIFSKNSITLQYPSKEQIITSSLFAPYSDTSTFKSFLDSVDSKFYQTWDSSVRTGYLLGTPTQKIVKDVLGEVAKNAKVQELGLMNNLKNSIKANTRTVLQAIANETRQKVFEENEELFNGYRYYSTLDKRACLVCGNFDGITKKKITDFGVRIPIHYNCRCVILPIVKGFEDMYDTRASKNGQVSDKLNYENWLEKQSDDTKKYVLGTKRFELYEKGQKFSSFVSDENRIITLSKMSQEIKVASPNEQKPITSIKFKAKEWSEKFKDPFASGDNSVNYLMARVDDKDELNNKILEIEAKNSKLKATTKLFRKSGIGVKSVYTEERNILHKKIINNYILESSEAITNESEIPKVILLGGRAGSGKSCFNNLVYNKNKYLVIDSDDIKKHLPEYQEWNANQVSLESSDIMKKLLNKATKLRMNIVIDGTMSSMNSSMQLLQELKNKGYYTEIDYMFLPPQESFSRALNRFSNNGKFNGRYVPLKVLTGMTENERVFDELKDYADNWQFFSNYGVKKGDKPILISAKYF